MASASVLGTGGGGMGTLGHEARAQEPHFINNSHTFRVWHLGDRGRGHGDIGACGHGHMKHQQPQPLGFDTYRTGGAGTWRHLGMGTWGHHCVSLWRRQRFGGLKFLVGSESNVRQRQPQAEGAVRATITLYFRVAKATFWRLEGYNLEQKATLGTGSRRLKAWSILQYHGVSASQRQCFGGLKAAIRS